MQRHPCNVEHHLHVLVLLGGWEHHQPHVHAMGLEVGVDAIAVEREHLEAGAQVESGAADSCAATLRMCACVDARSPGHGAVT